MTPSRRNLLGKNRRGHKERSREQELKYENQKMRKQISSLQKQLARLDLDRHTYVKDILDEHYANEEVELNTQDMLKHLKNEWRCHDCGDGFLEITVYSKMGEPWYFRQCNGCEKRTRSQIYTPNVTGIMREIPKNTDKKKR